MRIVKTEALQLKTEVNKFQFVTIFLAFGVALFRKCSNIYDNK